MTQNIFKLHNLPLRLFQENNAFGSMHIQISYEQKNISKNVQKNSNDAF